jgi:PHD/YefM family antitoxin component YafN of YafNO toxin-antitoxin module
MNISLTELTNKGISVIENNLNDSDELIITVSGEERFVIMRTEHYNYLRKCELELALSEAKSCLETGDFVIESVQDHIKRITDDL